MAKPLLRKKRDPYGNVRLNLRWPPELDRFARQYAAEHNTTVTAMIINLFTQLKLEKEHGERVEQL